MRPKRPATSRVGTALRHLIEWTLALLLGAVLLFRGLEWFHGQVADIGANRSGAAPTRPVVSLAAAPPAAAAPPGTLRGPRTGPTETQPALVEVQSDNAAFAVAKNVWATSESLTDGYGTLSHMRVPGGTTFAKVAAYDREHSGVALVETPGNLPVPPLRLASAAGLRPGQRLRALAPAIDGSAHSMRVTFRRLRVENGVVTLEIEPIDRLPRGAPILDDAGRVVGIVIGRREREEVVVVAADHVQKLLRGIEKKGS